MGNIEIAGWEGFKRKREMSLDCHTAASLGVLEFFVDCKRHEISRKNATGWTPLMYACAFGHSRLVELLLQHGAATDVHDNVGRTAVMLAVAYGHADILNVLLQSSPQEALEAVDDRGWTALFYAAHMGQLECLQVLIQHKCDVNTIASQSGETALMVAVRCGNMDFVKVLLRCGADATVVTGSGTSALSVAEALGFMEVADVLWINIVGTCWGSLSLSKFLNFLNLSKYDALFLSKNIDFSKFLTMNEEDLKKTGVRLLGPRKKMSLAISKWHYFSSMQMKFHWMLQNNALFNVFPLSVYESVS
ncbi:ankyrin repeat and SAM domain-containing protein 3-like isoform X2 [Bacillus rossius redtenbacheri]|uniref:ankyrin repeat and SAM domain-containing protein 3-like isoform X2 n=1 Tax=Bacillus rossius redtenbacheri TaxID=93214 RepID=UPI002FDC9CD9